MCTTLRTKLSVPISASGHDAGEIGKCMLTSADVGARWFIIFIFVPGLGRCENFQEGKERRKAIKKSLIKNNFLPLTVPAISTLFSHISCRSHFHYLILLHSPYSFIFEEHTYISAELKCEQLVWKMSLCRSRDNGGRRFFFRMKQMF